VLQRESGYAPAHWRLGYWRMEEGDHDAARRCFTAALAVNPASEPAALGLLELELAAGHPDAVVEGLVGSALLEGRNGPHALRMLGTALQRAGRSEEAEALLATYRKARPAFRDPWSEEVHDHGRGMATVNRRARDLIGEGRALEAVRLLEGARELEPEHVVILRTLGAAYSAVGRTRDARDTLREASRLDPENLELRVDAAWASAMYGDLDEALAEAAAVLAEDGGFHKAYTLRTRILIDQGRQEEAVGAFRSALEHGAQEPEVAVDVGKTLIELGRPEEAAELFALVTSQDPGRLSGWIGAALVALELGRLDPAGDALDRARALHRLRRDAGDGPILEVLEARLLELREAGR
jgi:tetratricopeptide (TPR) repeat protein